MIQNSDQKTEESIQESKAAPPLVTFEASGEASISEYYDQTQDADISDIEDDQPSLELQEDTSVSGAKWDHIEDLLSIAQSLANYFTSLSKQEIDSFVTSNRLICSYNRHATELLLSIQKVFGSRIIIFIMS